MHRRLAVVAASLLLASQFAAEGQRTTTGRRLALVIGNKAYGSSPLSTPANDAADMAALLKTLGFSVRLHTDLTYSNFRRAVNEFADSLRTGDTVLFYYSGHGLEVEGRNYLPPVDFDFQTTREAEVSDKSISTNNILKQIRDRNPATVILILDACRNNPLRGNRGGDQGLAVLNGERGEYIAFATAPGHSASDISAGGRNGLFTKHLLASAGQPGLTINDVFDRVRAQVDKESDGHQTPWSNSGLIGTFYFNPGAAPAVASPVAPLTPAPVGASRGTADCPEPTAAPASEGEFFSRARCAFLQGDMSATVQYANEAIRKNGGNAEYFFLRAQAQTELRQFDRAEGDFNKAIDLNPDKADFPYELGKLQLLRGDYVDAATTLQGAYNIARDRRDICLAFAEALDKTSQTRTASDVRRACGN
jgi:tetratricopeptide (TPR) repeat protein